MFDLSPFHLQSTRVKHRGRGHDKNKEYSTLHHDHGLQSGSARIFNLWRSLRSTITAASTGLCARLNHGSHYGECQHRHQHPICAALIIGVTEIRLPSAAAYRGQGDPRGSTRGELMEHLDLYRELLGSRDRREYRTASTLKNFGRRSLDFTPSAADYASGSGPTNG